MVSTFIAYKVHRRRVGDRKQTAAEKKDAG